MRAPVAPHRHFLAVALIVLLYFRGLATFLWSGSGQGELRMGLLLLSELAVFLAIPSLRVPAFWKGESRWVWGRYYGVFVLLGLIRGGLRGFALNHYHVGEVRADYLVLECLACVVQMVAVAFVAERQAFLEAEARGRAAATREALKALLLSRESLARMQAEQRGSALGRLEQRVEPALDAFAERLAKLEARLAGGVVVPESSWKLLLAELDAVCDEEIRLTSHSLHPSIIKVGLVPAILALLESGRVPYRVRFEASRALQAADDPRANRLPSEVRLAAYRVIEQTLASLASEPLAREVSLDLSLEGDAALALELVMPGEALGRGGFGNRAREAIASRIEPLGGTWDLASEAEAGVRLRVVLPVGAAQLVTGT